MNQNYNRIDPNEPWYKRGWKKFTGTMAAIKQGFEDHPELIVPFLTSALSIGSTAINLGTDVARERRLTKQETEKDRRVYDPETGITYELRRPMTNQQKVEYARLLRNRSAGETRADILDEMRLLK